MIQSINKVLKRFGVHVVRNEDPFMEKCTSSKESLLADIKRMTPEDVKSCLEEYLSKSGTPLNWEKRMVIYRILEQYLNVIIKQTTVQLEKL